MFEKLGFGMIKNDLNAKFLLVEWLLSKRQHFMKKSFLYILDEKEIDGYRS
tara:strand:- start:149 stop:301 length:153 start_codon:yes stop_codon:yes gene_type:complete